MSSRTGLVMGVALAALLAACSGSAPASPTPASATQAPGTADPGPTATSGATGPANLEAVDEIEAGKEFEVSWTGPNAQGDYITIVQAGATQWTNEEYFTVSAGSPESLTAPSTPGAYELWYVSDADDMILARRAIEVTPFQGALQAPAEVMGGTVFEVAWNGPNGPGDYVTIVELGATQWTNESYFNTSQGSPGELIASTEPGSYEIWYVIGSDRSIQARIPITITPPVVTLEAPDIVGRGEAFQVTWTGPDGPGDYITIVPAGSAPGTYLSYDNTSGGSPAELTAPDMAGEYEIWYAVNREGTTLLAIPITVR